jgi:RNA polymerase sigma factor (TIGR02999 family)
MSTYPNGKDAVNATAEQRSGPPGGGEAFEQVYARLKAIAGRQIAQDRASTLNTTELVHELYERMSRQDLQQAGGPRQFFAYAAHAMRNILIDRARHRLAQKSGGDWIRVTVSASWQGASYDLALDVVALNEALEKLGLDDERAARVVELRYFGGLSAEQVAQVLGVDRRTVTRDWSYARAFLQAELAAGNDNAA